MLYTVPMSNGRAPTDLVRVPLSNSTCKTSGRTTNLSMIMDRPSHRFVLDTGCERSILPLSYVPAYHLQRVDKNVITVNGTPIIVSGETLVNLQLRHLMWDFYKRCLIILQPRQKNSHCQPHQAIITSWSRKTE